MRHGCLAEYWRTGTKIQYKCAIQRAKTHPTHFVAFHLTRYHFEDLKSQRSYTHTYTQGRKKQHKKLEYAKWKAHHTKEIRGVIRILSDMWDKRHHTEQIVIHTYKREENCRKVRNYRSSCGIEMECASDVEKEERQILKCKMQMCRLSLTSWVMFVYV